MMLLIGVAAAAAQGRLSAAQDALLGGGAEAAAFCLSMAGAYAFFGGLLGVLRESGVTGALANALRRPLFRLFRFAPGEEQALSDISVNLAADMLGMGGAATPAGLSAMRKMAAAGR
ncbi:MAG: nucleoside recognition protein, partial [Candidatus Ventricola sp.]|nr:nucleoside recognition protein [Candidatus Ventricola sp.]